MMCGGHTSEGGGSSGCHTGTMGFGAGFGFGAAMLLKWLQQHAQHAGGGRAAGGRDGRRRRRREGAGGQAGAGPTREQEKGLHPHPGGFIKQYKAFNK